MSFQPNEDDGEKIIDMTARAGVFEPVEVDCVVELWNEYQQKGADISGYHFIVYREGSQVLGFACYGPRALTEGTYDLYWIVVDPAGRRSGIGRKLLEQVEKEVRLLGGRLIFVETSGLDKYDSTRRFYLSAGYEQEAAIRDFYRPGDDLVIFTRHLENAGE